MFVRMVRGTFARQWKKMFMIALTVALGASIATAMLNVMLDVGDKINEELKAYGSNITVVPQSEAVIDKLYDVEDETAESAADQMELIGEEKVGELLTIFWANNITDFAPEVTTRVQLNGEEVTLVGTWFNHKLAFRKKGTIYDRDTGIINLRSWWDVTEGEMLNEQQLYPFDDGAAEQLEEGQILTVPQDTYYAVIGADLAAKQNLHPGDKLTVRGKTSLDLMVVGVYESGDDEDSYIYTTLPAGQALAGTEGMVQKIEVSAITSPDDELAVKAARNPNLLSGDEYDTWYCTAYVSSICFQIQEAIPEASASAVRQIADSEGKVVEKTQLLMTLITIMSLIGATLGISNLVTSGVMERSAELALLKVMGAKNSQITFLVLIEVVLTAILGAAAGYFMGYGFAQVIGQSVFNSSIDMSGMVAFIVVVLIIAVTLVGSIPAIRTILRPRPSEVLHGGH